MKRHGSMNQIYRLVWSQVLNGWVAVAETARGKGKGSRRKLIAAALALGASLAQAAPVGGQVVSGSGSISQSGATITITQGGQNLSLNWKGFNIAPQETVNFVQPNASAIAVNRIYDTQGTQILGRLNANGQVYLINPNGILFGQGAQVNVGGLVASTLDLNDASLSGNKRLFSGNGAGSVVNQGTINAAAGGYVALLGNHVSNQGVIVAQLGSVALGAGSAATLTFSGNNLVSMQVDQSTLNNLAENGGLIQADGGLVVMNAGAKDALLASVVNNTGVIEARTAENHAGTITLLGGMTAGTVNVGGTLDASAPSGGNGGFVETSAANVKVGNDAKITTAAAMGLTGTWLIDPTDFTIAASGGDMTGATLGTNLGSGNVTILSTSGTSGTSGNVNVNDVVTWGANKLTLNAQNNININANLNGSGTASLALQYGQGAVAAGNLSTYGLNGAQINLPAGNNFSTMLGSNGVTTAYTVIDSLGLAGSVTGTDLQGINGHLGGKYVLGSNIDATATSGWNSGAGFTPIGTYSSNFTGIFDGLGHTISNLTINQPGTSFVGLFGFAGISSVIRNVGLVGGSVSGNNEVGELVGYNNGGTVSNSYATGSVSGNVYIGGLVGYNSGTVSNSYATGSVSGGNNSQVVGGLVGYNDSGTVSNSYATGSVSGSSNSNYVGGLVGYNNGTVSNSYATGSVSGTYYVGGLVGINAGTVSGSFWDTQTSGQSTSSGGVGMTTAQMQTQANFTSATPANGNVNPGWDFLNTWVMYDTYTYPLLRSFMTPLTVTANNATVTYDGQNYAGQGGVSYSSTPNASLLGTATYGGTANAGTYTITPSGLYSNQQGYIISYVSGTLTVDPKSLTVAGTSASNKVYDSTTAATLTGGSLVGVIGSDAVTLAQSGAFASPNAGTGLAVTVTDSLGGSVAGNYTVVAPTSLTANITPKSLTVAGTSASNKVYDSTTVATLTGGSLVGVIGSDAVTLAQSGTFASPNAGTGIAVTAADTLGGSAAGNYTVVAPTGLTANITPATLTIAGTTRASNKVYDGTTTATLTGGLLAGVIGSDAVTLAQAGSFASPNPGTGIAVTAADTLAGSAAGNYTIARQPTVLPANIAAVPAVPVIPVAPVVPITPVVPVTNHPDTSLATALAPVLNAMAQLESGVLSYQTGAASEAFNPSSTIVVTQLASGDTGAASTSATDIGAVANAMTTIGSTGPALHIVNGGMKLPNNIVNVNE
ncbi:YDG domain-containing protein [Collimonas silvisoli]|uniref:YDG domain-containing protein n=1 Tax=Collimonas silvisoli TaxID=2825884 RepID=UPI001B8C191B|nr:YDG domain-containing protein [Collimonas silvisoli]